MFDKDDNYIQTFSSVLEAAEFIKQSQNKECNKTGISVHIRQVANGKRKTAYGYKWKFV